jgi:hypothetical protein
VPSAHLIGFKRYVTGSQRITTTVNLNGVTSHACIMNPGGPCEEEDYVDVNTLAVLEKRAIAKKIVSYFLHVSIAVSTL